MNAGATIRELISEYIRSAEAASRVDYGDEVTVQRFNEFSDRMRTIVDEVLKLGQLALLEFSSVLDIEPAAEWAAFHLVEKAHLDSKTIARCFARIEMSKTEAEANGNLADAKGIEAWLREWKAKAR